MPAKIIIGLFILSCALIYNFSPAQAQKKASFTPATHMWMQSYNDAIFVRVSSLEECELLTAQAAALNSAESHCYNKDLLLKKIHCTKPLKRDETAKCS